MQTSHYVELAIAAVVIIVGVILVVICSKKVSYLRCDCKICQGKDIKGERIDKIETVEEKEDAHG